MNYRLFDMTCGVQRELPFRPGEEGAPDCRLVEEPKLVDRIEDDDLGILRAEGCELQYGGWLCALRPGAGVVEYCERPLGELELPLWHVLERLVLPLYATISDDDRNCLHASGVVLEGGAWLFIGDTGSGKSTTAYELMRRYGAGLVSDEMAVVDVPEGEILAGSPGVRLRPEQVEDDVVDSGTIHPALEKRWYRFSTDRLASGRVALEGVVRLTPGESDVDGDGALPAFEAIGGSRRLTQILEQTFEFREAPRSWRERRFRNAAAFAKSARFREFRFRRSSDGGPTHVDALYDFLREAGA